MQPQEMAKTVADGQESMIVPAVKIGTAWAAVGITSWADAASALAFLYTLLLVLEWLWKKAGRPFMESRGWIKRRARRTGDLQ